MREQEPPLPWWRPTVRDVVVVALVTAVAGWLYWPREPPGPPQQLRNGVVAGTQWSVMGQRAGSGQACVQVRVGGARRALMCDQHWDRDIVRLWHGTPPPTAGAAIGPVSVLRIRFPGTDQVLIASVLYDEIAVLRAADGTVAVHTRPLYDTGLHYVADVVAAGAAADLRAFAADGEPLFYHYVDAAPSGGR